MKGFCLAVVFMAAMGLWACGASSGRGGSGPTDAAGSGADGQGGPDAPFSDGDAATGPATDAETEGGSGPAGPSGLPGSPGPPDFGPNVFIFDPAMPMAAIQGQIDAIYAQQAGNQFGTNRYAFMFKPGSYTVGVKVGYYTQVLGLGQSPGDVVINGTVQSTGNSAGNATLSFWRSCENVTVAPPGGQLEMWAVSQGTALRRVHVRGALTLADAGFSSGGFMADSKIDGQVTSGSQQQWFSRNSEWGSWTGGVWNMVFVGTIAPPAGIWPAAPYTVVDRTPLLREKPFLFLDAAGRYLVMVPGLARDTSGVSWSDAAASPGVPVPLEQFHIAHAGQDNAATINTALAAGKNLLLTPGIYHLESNIVVSRPHTIVLGLGMATLVPDNGTSALVIADVDDVTIGGIIIDAGPGNSSTLLQVGNPGAAQDHSQAPTFLHDVFCRVGGGSAGTASSCATINSNDVVGDNLWMWRADHGAGVGWTQNRSANGLIVNGNDVTMYGLFVEHFQEVQTLWNGERGRVFFYQSEMPYDPPDQPSWQRAGVSGYPAYKVADTVTTHEARGLGVYCAFRALVAAYSAFEAPTATGVSLNHLVTVWLNGVPGSSINHILNGTGAAVTQAARRATAD